MEKKWWPSLSVLKSRGVRPLHLVAPLSFTALILLMLWFPGSRTSALPPDLDAPFPTPLYLMHVIGQVFGGVEYEYDFYFAYSEQPNTDGWVLVPDGSGGYIATHTAGPVSGPHTTPRQACQALPAGVTSFQTIYVVYNCVEVTSTPTHTPTPTKTPRPTATATLEAPSLTAKAIDGEIVICSSNVQGGSWQQADSPSEDCKTITDGQEVLIREGTTFTQLLNDKRRTGGFEVSAECEEKGLFLLEIIFSDKKISKEKGLDLVVLLQAIMPILGKACEDGRSASAQSITIPLDHALTFALEQGQIEVTLKEQAVSMGFETKTASISATNLNHFLIGYDPATKETKITSLGGSLNVTPANTSLPVFTLAPFQQVTVSPNTVGDIVELSRVYLPTIHR